MPVKVSCSDSDAISDDIHFRENKNRGRLHTTNFSLDTAWALTDAISALPNCNADIPDKMERWRLRQHVQYMSEIGRLERPPVPFCSASTVVASSDVGFRLLQPKFYTSSFLQP